MKTKKTKKKNKPNQTKQQQQQQQQVLLWEEAKTTSVLLVKTMQWYIQHVQER